MFDTGPDPARTDNTAEDAPRRLSWRGDRQPGKRAGDQHQLGRRQRWRGHRPGRRAQPGLL